MKNVSAAALPQVSLLSQGVVDATIARDSSEAKLIKAQAVFDSAQSSVTDLLIADGFIAADFASPKKEQREVLITRGEKTATKAAFYADVCNLATIAIDRKLMADSETGTDGLKWSKKEKQFHIRTAKLSKEQLAAMSGEEKAKRTRLRQEIGAYVGAFRRDLAAREERAKLEAGTGNGETSEQRAAHSKRTPLEVDQAKAKTIIKRAQEQTSEKPVYRDPTAVAKAAKALLDVLK